MSREISIFYKLISSDDNKLIYGYSGANINKEYEKNYLLEYDGIIEISINALKNKTLTEAFSNNEIKNLKDCRYEYHHEKLAHGDSSLGFFAVNAVSKIFREYKESMQIVDKGSVIY